ncbi:hypothetical protein SODALDRAFT_329494 [Sodiomyces alkalinus F11]|uniref:Integral membrane protein n=1 Tax=Sodiomyces alkalinus (strain CBS 110278 / VKM F-3762 / F11) TaxID=1314773 RepID=A0A3N2PJM4_SODAK|nr:hypothetical protein SODALDRAFT_329494 [Sodiomyces alkalinus F11]ROT34630.1 hypothetical protein SODALDRAFT_329494 [Sodiomyces alkalinus F11]
MTSQAIFAMAVSISSLVLLVQRPPLIERDLIEKLGAFQALCALQVIYVPTVLSLSEGGFGPNRTKRLWHRIKHSPSTRRILTSVIILPPLLGVAIEYQPDNLRSLYNDAVANPAVCPDHVITRTKAVDGAVVAVLAFVVVVNVIFTVAKTFFGSNSTRRWLLAYGIVSGYSLCVSQALQLGWLFDYRTQARDVAGEEYEDNEWGFGQVLAVFSWAPTLMECGYWFIKTLIHRQDSWRSWRDVKESPWDRDYCSQKRSQAGDGATAIPMLDSER